MGLETGFLAKISVLIPKIIAETRFLVLAEKNNRNQHLILLLSGFFPSAQRRFNSA